MHLAHVPSFWGVLATKPWMMLSRTIPCRSCSFCSKGLGRCRVMHKWRSLRLAEETRSLRGLGRTRLPDIIIIMRPTPTIYKIMKCPAFKVICGSCAKVAWWRLAQENWP